MKPKKPNPPRSGAKLLHKLPRDFYQMPELELRGGYLLTDGCRRVLDFSPERICLDLGNFIVSFYGQELRIESLAGKRLILAGKITRIELKNKWEGAV